MSHNRERQHRAEQAAKHSSNASDLAPGAVTLVEAQLGGMHLGQQPATHRDTNERASNRTAQPDLWANIDGLQFQRGETLDAFSDVIQGIAVQRKAERGTGTAEQGAAQELQRASSDLGSPLPEPLRERFESSLGTDLSQVRVHTGSASASAAAAVGAKAYTTQQDIHFAAGMFDPSSRAGQQLLAHEVAHTVQQAGSSSTAAQFKLNVSQPGDAHEHEADQAADAMIAGTRATVSKGSVTGVLARQAAEDVCSTPDAPLVCAPPASNVWEAQQQSAPSPNQVAVPAALDVPVREQCVLPPPPRNWSTTPAAAECPSEEMSGGAGYRDEFAAENLDTYKAAFNASWSELQSGYNAVVLLNRGYKEKEKEVIPLLQVDAGRVVGAGVTGVDATTSFDGGKLKAPLTKVDSTKLSPDLRAQIFKARDKISAAKLEIENKRDSVENATDKLGQAVNAVDIAANAIHITESDQQIANRQLDKEQVKRDLDQQKANIKATVESAKLITSIINCWSDPTKLFSNVIGAVNQGINAGGAIAEAAYVSDANEKLNKLDGEIRELTNYKASLQVTNAQKVLDSAIKEVRVKIREAQIAVRQMQTAKRAYHDAYRDMATLMEKAGAASGLKPKDRKALSGAVEALPKIEIIQQQLASMDQGLKIPQYTGASGIGAAMAWNLSAFTHGIAVLKGNKDYVAELKAVWEGRHAAVLTVIDQSVSVAGDDSFAGE